MAENRQAKQSKKQQESKKGRPRSAGCRKGKFEAVFIRGRERKLRHVLKRNGPREARAYAERYEILPLLRKISRTSSYAGRVAARAVAA